MGIPNIKSRFSEAKWAENPKEWDIIIGGQGGIGSWLSFFLASIGYNLHVYDFDTVEDVNLGGQLFCLDDIGSKKTTAIKTTIQSFRDETITTYEEYTEDSLVTPIMISGFDNMAARKLMFEKWKAQEDRIAYFDGRLLAELGMYYCVLPGQEELYETELFSDDEVEPENCSYKSTTHCSAYIASQLTALVTNVIYNHKMGVEIRSTPLKTVFDFSMMSFEVEEIEIPVEAELEKS